MEKIDKIRRDKLLYTHLTICEKHFEELVKRTGEDKQAFIAKNASVLLFDFVDGDKFSWDYLQLYDAILKEANGCPFCYLKNEKYEDEVVEMAKKDENTIAYIPEGMPSIYVDERGVKNE